MLCRGLLILEVFLVLGYFLALRGGHLFSFLPLLVRFVLLLAGHFGTLDELRDGITPGATLLPILSAVGYVLGIVLAHLNFMPVLAQPKALFLHLGHLLDTGVKGVGLLREFRNDVFRHRCVFLRDAGGPLVEGALVLLIQNAFPARPPADDCSDDFG